MNTPNSSIDAALQDIAGRHGFGLEATRSMFDAVAAGRGGMAQFAHPEFGGSGQWMRGGMTMVSNLFDDTLRSRVDALCTDLAGLVGSQGDVPTQGSFQSQTSGDHSRRGPFASSSSQHWWPADLGSPDSTGSQDDARYAWFAPAARLAIEVDGRVTVYDTQDHRITGFSQAQSQGSSMGFHSQHGDVDVGGLPVVSRADSTNATPIGEADPATAVRAAPSAGESLPGAGGTPPPETGDAPRRDALAEPSRDEVFSHIEKLAALHARGVLTDDEFRDKKAELLGRL
jgi:hypothetical protein